MDNFIVSARKYRPQSFDTVVGQQHIVTTLKNAIKNNHLAHAFLFCGPRGVGKTTCARILAKTINCTSKTPDGEACDTCSSCVNFNDGTSLNIHEIDAASNNSVEGIRTLVEQVRFSPQGGKYKVYIVDEVHMLSASAFNAFLKTLEEPPAHAIFILATTEKHKILPTILSRCQIFDFKRITPNDTIDHLQNIANKEGIVADRASLQVIAQKSEGCMRDALSILDKIVSFSNGSVQYENTIEHLNILDYDYFFKLLKTIDQQNMANALLLFDEINQKGFEGDMVLNGFAEFIRNILVCKDAKAIKLLDVVEGTQDKYTSVAQQTDTAFLITALNILNEAELGYKAARNKRLHIELTLIKLCFLQQAITINADNNTTGIATQQVVQKKKSNNGIRYIPMPQIQIAISKKTGTTNNSSRPAAKLTIEQPVVVKQTPTVEVRAEEPMPANYIAEKLSKPTISTKASASTIRPTSSNKTQLLLDVLKQKIGQQAAIVEVKEAYPLEINALQACWQNYIEQMELQGGKLSTIGTFKAIELSIENEHLFKVTVSSLTQQRFIEQERTYLLELIQNKFNNRAIQLVFEQTQDGTDEEQNRPLSKQEQYIQIVETYPLVEELRAALKFNLLTY